MANYIYVSRHGKKGPIDNFSYFSVNACKLLYITVSLFA